MKQDFSKARKNIPPVTFYDGDVVMDQGEAKIEWFDPAAGFFLMTEKELEQKEAESRSKLGTGSNSACWTRQRNIHYSAERGLDKIQRYKLQAEMKLDTARAPVIR